MSTVTDASQLKNYSLSRPKPSNEDTVFPAIFLGLEALAMAGIYTMDHFAKK